MLRMARAWPGKGKMGKGMHLTVLTVIQVVGVLPNIDDKERRAVRIGDDSTGVGRVHDLKVTITINQPCPSASKVCRGELLELHSR